MLEIRLNFTHTFFILIFITIIFLLALYVSFTSGSFDTLSFYIFGGEIPSLIARGDYWLLITSNFFHIDITHYLFNAISLYRIGHMFEDFYDGKFLFSVFIYSGLGGTLLTYFVYLFGGVELYSLGASAGIFGLIGVLLGGSLKKYRYGLELPFSFRDLLPFVVIAFLFGFFPGMNINNWAHFGGLATGFVFGLFVPNFMNKLSKTTEIIIKIFYFSAIIIFLLSYYQLFANLFNILSL